MAEITKMWIADKMREIMKHKPISKIRVTEICRAAEIERPTFYYHFKDKYDLVAWMFYTEAYETDITSAVSAAAGMNKMKQQILFYKRASQQFTHWGALPLQTFSYSPVPVIFYSERRHFLYIRAISLLTRSGASVFELWPAPMIHLIGMPVFLCQALL